MSAVYAEGSVGYSALGAFEQADNPPGENGELVRTYTEPGSSFDFYDPLKGLYFNSTERHTKAYTNGDFHNYNIVDGAVERSESDVLSEKSYENIHLLPAQSSGYAASSHDFKESISVNYDKIRYYEGGLGSFDTEYSGSTIASKAVAYVLDVGLIPLEKIRDSSGGVIDTEYRGKFLFMGEEYYARNIQGFNMLFLTRGEIIENVTSSVFSRSYDGYRFRLNSIERSDSGQILNITVDAELPDNTIEYVQPMGSEPAIVGDVQLMVVDSHDAGGGGVDLMAYYLPSMIVLEDGKDVVIGVETKQYWKVTMNHVNVVDVKASIPEYSSAATGELLANITVEYRHQKELVEGGTLDFPISYKISFLGARKGNFLPAVCSPQNDIYIRREGKDRAKIGFTADNGQRYDDVFIDQGGRDGFSRGDMFLAGGLLYQYDEAHEPSDDPLSLSVTLKDLLNGGEKTFSLQAIASEDILRMRTYPFEDSSGNTQEIIFHPDTVREDSDVYIGNGPTGSILFSGGQIFLVYNSRSDVPLDYTNAVGLLQREPIGVDQKTIGEFSRFSEGTNLKLSVVNEDVTNLVPERKIDEADDRLIQVQDSEGEYLVIDFFDQSFNDSSDTYYSEGVWASGIPLDSTDPWTVPRTGDSDYSHRWDSEKDTLVMLPERGVSANIDYGGAREIQSVRICAPSERISPTIFVGKEELHELDFPDTTTTTTTTSTTIVGPPRPQPIPHIMEVGGRLFDRFGNPLNGEYKITFRLYDSANSAKPSWNEIYDGGNLVTVIDGRFNVRLGSKKPIDTPFMGDTWLGIEVESDGEMIPRRQLASVPYSFRCESADRLDPQCPEDMADMGDFCIDKRQQASNTYYNHILECRLKGKKMCTTEQFYVACKTSSGLEDLNGRELLADRLIVYNPGCDVSHTGGISNDAPSRCCI
ncbi:MAG: hypothetical protein V1875_04830 [Candidatus Altiarchaeota archaeon]